jgi:hypothetical protein
VTAVDIPDQAMDIAWRTFSESLAEAGSHLDYVEALADAITAIAPIIVAAEFRRQVDQGLACTVDETWLIERADELDPQGIS